MYTSTIVFCVSCTHAHSSKIKVELSSRRDILIKDIIEQMTEWEINIRKTNNNCSWIKVQLLWKKKTEEMASPGLYLKAENWSVYSKPFRISQFCWKKLFAMPCTVDNKEIGQSSPYKSDGFFSWSLTKLLVYYYLHMPQNYFEFYKY